MEETVFGYHAVESLLRLDPKRVTRVLVQSIATTNACKLCEHGANQGVALEPCPRQDPG